MPFLCEFSDIWNNWIYSNLHATKYSIHNWSSAEIAEKDKHRHFEAYKLIENYFRVVYEQCSSPITLWPCVVLWPGDKFIIQYYKSSLRTCKENGKPVIFYVNHGSGNKVVCCNEEKEVHPENMVSVQCVQNFIAQDVVLTMESMCVVSKSILAISILIPFNSQMCLQVCVCVISVAVCSHIY